jgi:hypothetical protein
MVAAFPGAVTASVLAASFWRTDVHSFTGKQGTIFHHNSDMSGDVFIIRKVYDADGREGESERLDIPGDDLMDFVASVIQHRMVCRIEDMTTEEILRGGL